MLIAVFTIFVFGGAITKVAITLNVLEDKDKKANSPDLLHALDSRMSVFTTEAGGFGSGWKAVLETMTHDSIDESGAVDRKGQRKSLAARRNGSCVSFASSISSFDEDPTSTKGETTAPESSKGWFDFMSPSKQPKLTNAQMTRGNLVSISSDDLINKPSEPFMV